MVKRFDGYDTTEEDDGAWVLYDEHTTAMKEQKEWIENKLMEVVGDCCVCREDEIGECPACTVWIKFKCDETEET